MAQTHLHLACHWLATTHSIRIRDNISFSCCIFLSVCQSCKKHLSFSPFSLVLLQMIYSTRFFILLSSSHCLSYFFSLFDLLLSFSPLSHLKWMKIILYTHFYIGITIFSLQSRQKVFTINFPPWIMLINFWKQRKVMVLSKYYILDWSLSSGSSKQFIHSEEQTPWIKNRNCTRAFAAFVAVSRTNAT